MMVIELFFLFIAFALSRKMSRKKTPGRRCSVTKRKHSLTKLGAIKKTLEYTNYCTAVNISNTTTVR